MSIHQRPDRALGWQVRWRQDGRQCSRSFATRKEAVRFEASVLAELAAADRVSRAGATMRLADWLEQWARVHGPTWAPSTRSGRALYADKWIIPFIGDVPLSGIGRGVLHRWRAGVLSDGASNDTANHALRVLSAALSTAVEEGLLAANPALGMRALRHRVARPRALSDGEVAALMDACRNDRDLRLLALMAYAGLRPGEVLALEWESVGERIITVDRSQRSDGSISTPKSGRPRTVVIRPELAPHLDARSGRLVCPRLDTGGPLDWRAWYRHQWVRDGIRDRAGVDCAPYDLRHTFASRRIAEGASVVEVAAEMGHTDPALTLRRYAHLFDAHRASVSATDSRMARAIRPDGPGRRRGTDGRTA